MGKGPIVIAYDGSKAARAAIVRMGELCAPRQALIVTVWEPGLGEMMLVPDPTGLGTTMMPYDPTIAREIDREAQDRARALALDGVELARGAGLHPEPLVIEDVSDVAEAILSAAQEHDAAAIVIGSRGHRGLRSRLLGSTSAGVLKGAGSRPVLIVHAAPDEES